MFLPDCEVRVRMIPVIVLDHDQRIDMWVLISGASCTLQIRMYASADRSGVEQSGNEGGCESVTSDSVEQEYVHDSLPLFYATKRDQHIDCINSAITIRHRDNGPVLKWETTFW